MDHTSPFFLPGTRRSVGDALIVNIFGGPGIGKTTLAARLFAELKSRDVEAACPEEYAKIALWQGRDYLLDNQLILLGRTWDMISSLSNKVDVIILDSPILLCSHYAGQREPKHFHQTVLDFHQRQDRINILLQRDHSMAYSTAGRRESSDRAKEIDLQIASLLAEAEENYVSMDPASMSLDPLTWAVLASLSRSKSLD